MVLERIPILGVERVALAHCVGRVLAEDLIATESLPAFPASAVDGSFDTGLVSPGSSATLQFDVPGVYAYMCTPHPWMKGNVAVN